MAWNDLMGLLYLWMVKLVSGSLVWLVGLRVSERWALCEIAPLPGTNCIPVGAIQTRSWALVVEVWLIVMVRLVAVCLVMVMGW